MKKRLLLIPISLAALLLDTALLQQINFFGLRPFMCFALVLACVLDGSIHEGMIIAVLTGFVIDLCCNTWLGLSSALMLLGLIVLRLALKKNAMKKLVVFLLCCAIVFSTEAVISLLMYLTGAKHNIVFMMTTYMLPCAVLTALTALAFFAMLRGMSKGQLESERKGGLI